MADTIYGLSSNCKIAFTPLGSPDLDIWPCDF